MKAMLHLACLLILCGAAMAQVGSWTLYYSDTRVANPDGSVTLRPTLGITGDDEGYCSVFANGQGGWETPFVMLNGNTWAEGGTYDSGGPYNGGSLVDFSYTFPDVTAPADGSEIDLSYATKVHGVCPLSSFPVAGPPYTKADFYNYPFTDGREPAIPPGPCFIIMGFSPQCGTPWPPVWRGLPARVVAHDLVSMKVSLKIRSATTITVTATQDPGTGTDCGVGEPCTNPAKCHVVNSCTAATSPPTCDASGTLTDYSILCDPAHEHPFVVRKLGDSTWQCWAVRSHG